METYIYKVVVELDDSVILSLGRHDGDDNSIEDLLDTFRKCEEKYGMKK